jgi:hypothetical protein
MRRIVRPVPSLVTAECTSCKDQITVMPKDIGPGNIVFCSFTCKKYYLIRGVPTGTKRKKYTNFYMTQEWKALRRIVIRKYGRNCASCNIYCKGRNLHVDHIKPRKYFPELSLDFNNLQVLCKACNERKSSQTIDFRNTRETVNG